jgi:hypothetical protein
MSKMNVLGQKKQFGKTNCMVVRSCYLLVQNTKNDKRFVDGVKSSEFPYLLFESINF